jgi:hypothetical protein
MLIWQDWCPSCFVHTLVSLWRVCDHAIACFHNRHREVYVSKAGYMAEYARACLQSCVRCMSDRENSPPGIRQCLLSWLWFKLRTPSSRGHISPIGHLIADEKSMDWANKYLLGILTAGLVILLAERVVRNHLNGKGNRRIKKPLYRFDHSILNISLPPQSMWMNMGFWKVRYNHF